VQLILDQTLRMIAQGLDDRLAAENVYMPARLRDGWEGYGQVESHVRQVYNGNVGWFGGVWGRARARPPGLSAVIQALRTWGLPNRVWNGYDPDIAPPLLACSSFSLRSLPDAPCPFGRLLVL
jgi:alkyl sulfatase BDS1-like metallo-beta-lactamase superfamily hydrolase